MDSGGGGDTQGCLAVSNGFRFVLNDILVVDVFVGTAANIRGPKTMPVRGRFKGVRVEGGKEVFLVRPIVSSQRGRCPAYTPESCFKLKANGSDVYEESRPQFFSKLKPSAQERFFLSRQPHPPVRLSCRSSSNHDPPSLIIG